ncbi:hypothetical protein EDB56_11366 [Vibrio crassostreae]|nr:hypothetical protein EDB56_11366 [Vibrio crassostreae]
MLIDILISGITFIAITSTLIFSAWTYIDTRRKYSLHEFFANTKQKRKEARERFKERTRLEKRD